MSRLLIIALCLAIPALIGIVAGTTETFDTDLGKIQLNVPNNYVLKDPSSTNLLQFVKSGSEKPIISIVLDDAKIWGSDLVKYASGHLGEGKTYTETQTNDGHVMHFYALNDYGDTYSFNGIIDYTKDKGVIADVFGNSETVAYGQTLATFSEDEFLAVCKSFVFV